jgi:hypothetical protein
LLRYILIWLALLALAVGNGALRQATFGRVLPELRAHQVSTLIGSVVMGGFIWFVIAVWPPASGRQAIGIGVVWLGLTVAFEFFMGLVLLRRPPAQVLGDYNLRRGRVWALFLVWLTLAPWLFHSLHGTG